MRNQTARVMTIGNFDGVHRGHQALIHTAQRLAARRGESLVAMTFEPHPVAVLKGTLEHFLITPRDLRQTYLAWAGVQDVVEWTFTHEFAAMPAEQFLNTILGGLYAVTAVVVGYNFSFGQGGTGNPDLLRRWGAAKGVEIVIEPPCLDEEMHQTVSSSRVRKAISLGQMEQAEALLGHPFSVASTVVQGDQRGRQIGIPTLNMRPPVEQVMPPFGVYAGYIHVDEKVLKAVASFGVRPTFGGGDAVLEVHALDALPFHHYGQKVQFDCLYRLRDEWTFDSVEALMRQIGRDIATAEGWLQERESSG